MHGLAEGQFGFIYRWIWHTLAAPYSPAALRASAPRTASHFQRPHRKMVAAGSHRSVSSLGLPTS